jgi:hypothetical protein
LLGSHLSPHVADCSSACVPATAAGGKWAASAEMVYGVLAAERRGVVM